MYWSKTVVILVFGFYFGEREWIYKNRLLNRDNAKIRQMHKDVAQYEEIIRKQVIANEQARLKQLEIEQLNKEAEEIVGE